MNGKGSTPRPYAVSEAAFAESWERTFGQRSRPGVEQSARPRSLEAELEPGNTASRPAADDQTTPSWQPDTLMQWQPDQFMQSALANLVSLHQLRYTSRLT